MSGIDGKYGEITSSKKEFHPDEPIFLLRAQDPIAPVAIEAYAQICQNMGCTDEHVQASMEHATRIRQWQAENPELTKVLPGGTEFRLPPFPEDSEQTELA